MRSFVPLRARRARHGLGMVVLALSTMTTGCEFITGVPTVKRVDISLAPDTLASGETGVALGTAIGTNGNAITSSKVHVAYASSNPTIAAVNQTTGQITALAEGTTDITASSHGKSASAKLVVRQARVAQVVPSPNPLTVEVGRTTRLDLVAYDAQRRVLTNRAVTISSAVATIATASGATNNNIVVSGVSLGQTALTGNVEGVPFTVVVNVVNAGATKMTLALQKGGTTLLASESSQLVATFFDANGQALSSAGRTVTYQSSDQTVASVTPTGVVTGLKAGTTQITATEQGTGVTGKLDLTVATVPVKFLSFANLNPVFRKGAPRSAEAIALDSASNRLNRQIAYTSSNPAILSINPTSGIATPLDTGTATLTATVDNLTTRLNVRVTLLPIAQVTIQPLNAQVNPGETVQYSATVVDSLNNFVSDRKPTWSSSATSVATVNPSTGLATALGPGQTTISAIIERVPGEGVPAGGQVVLTVNLTKVDSIAVSSTSVTVARGSTVPITFITRDANGTQLFGRTVVATSQNAGVAVVASQSGSTLVIQGVSVGSTTIVLQAVNASGIAEGKPSVITVTVTTP